MEAIGWTADKRQTAAALFLLNGLSSAQQQERIAEAPVPVRFARGEPIYTTRRFHRALGLVLSGEIRVFCPGETERRVVMNCLKAGNVFGAAALYGEEERYVSDLVAHRVTDVWFLPQSLVAAWMQADFRMAENYIRFLTGRIRFLNQRIAEFTDGQADNRLLRYLLEHRQEDGAIRLPGSMVELAQTLNIGRSSLYRALDELTRSGWIRREGRRLYMDDIRCLPGTAQADESRYFSEEERKNPHDTHT